MAFATRSKFFWSRFIATCVRYLGVANTQHIRYVAEKLLPTEMSRQNILYHVRIAEEKGWIATFASSLEVTAENEILFRKEFVEIIGEKISAQRFVIIGTEGFEPASEEKIIQVCEEVKLDPITITDNNILSIVTEDSIKRLSSTKEKATGNNSLFMVLIRFGWFWLNINSEYTLKIVEAIKNNVSKHNFNEHYQIDVNLLEIVSLIEMETTPEITVEDLKGYLNTSIRVAHANKRKDVMNLMAMVLLISGRYLVSFNKLPIAEEYLNRGIKYLRLGTRKSILMRKLHVDGLFDLGFIYSQQGWFYKALGVYENIERIIDEEFSIAEPIDNLKGRLSHAKAELYLMMAYPAYTFRDDDYRGALLKSLKFARKASKIYQMNKNRLKISEINLLSAWICALIGRINRAEVYLSRGLKQMVAPVPPKLNGLYYSAQAEIFRKQLKYEDAISSISQSFDYFKILGHLYGKLFCMTRLAEIHVNLSQKDRQYSFISYGNMTALFAKGVSDMIGHVFLEFNKQMIEKGAVISFYSSEEVLANHPEIDNYAEILSGSNISPVLLGESFTILPETILNLENLAKKKISCISGTIKHTTNPYSFDNFKEELGKFDDLFQVLLSRK